jgi:hypothetical protein
MLDHNESSPGSRVVRWTDDEWARIAGQVSSQKTAEQANPLGLEEVKAKDIFMAQHVLPPDRHRKLVSIAQGFEGVRARLYTILQRPLETIPEVAFHTRCIEFNDAEPGEAMSSNALDRAQERAGVLEVLTNANDAANTGLPHLQPACEKIGTSAAKSARQNPSTRLTGGGGESRIEQTSNFNATRFNATRAEQVDRVRQERPAASNSASPAAGAPSLIDLARPFISMVCEEFARALVRVIAAQGSRNDLRARTPTGTKQGADSRQGESNEFWGLELRRDSTPDESTRSQRRITDDRAHPAALSEAFNDDHPDMDEMEVQPLFDPKLPPAANSAFKPNIGIVVAHANDLLELRHLYPQLNLTIVQADTIADVRKFGHCQRIIALRDEVSPATDELLGRLLRHRYVRVSGGTSGIKDQLNAWLEAPRSMMSAPRHAAPRYDRKADDDRTGKKQKRYPKIIGR